MAKAKPRFNPNEAAAKMFLSTQEEQVAHDTPDTQEEQSEQNTPSTHATQEVQNTLNTQSTQNTHKAHSTQRAQKHPRINMAFYGDNLEFVREAAWRNKQSITEYMNGLIEQVRNKKGE